MRGTNTTYVLLLGVAGIVGLTGSAERNDVPTERRHHLSADTPVPDEVISRAVTLVNEGGDLPVLHEVTARAVTVVNEAGELPAPEEAISRAVTVVNEAGELPAPGEAISRAVTVFSCQSTEPDCNDNGLADTCDIDAGHSQDCNGNGVPDECDIAKETSQDCNLNGIPDECVGCEDGCECGNSDFCDGVEICDPVLGCQPSPPVDCDDGVGCTIDSCNESTDSCDNDPNDAPCDNGQFCDGSEWCHPAEDCQPGTDPCSGLICDEEHDYCPGPPELPSDVKHQASKHRYLSVDTSVNALIDMALKVEIVSMRRCSGDPSRACTGDDDCEAAVAGSGTCVEHADVGTAGPWWVQAPQQEPLGCIPGPCGDEDWFASVDSTLYFDTWTLETLHVGDCEIIPVATYEIRACAPPDGVVCSDPLTIGTIEQPFVSPGFRGNYGDVAGAVEPVTESFAAPDGVTNVIDVSAYILTKQNYGTANKPQTHPTWVDLHGLGDGNPPQYILNISDMGQILKAFAGDAWTDDQGNVNPGECP